MGHWRHEKSLFFLWNLYVLGVSAFIQCLANLTPTWINFYPIWRLLGANFGQLGIKLGHLAADLGHLGSDLGQLKATLELT